MRRLPRAGMVLWLLVGACAFPERQREPAGSDEPLFMALRTMPANLGQTTFFAIGPVLRLGGEPPTEGTFEEKSEYLVDLGTAGYALDPAFFNPSLKEWGFDLFDLEWELQSKNSRALAFTDGFSFEALKARFQRCGFEVSRRHGATIYSHGGDPIDPCLVDEVGLGPPPSIANTALFEDEGIALMSFERDRVDAMMAAFAGETPSFADLPAFASLVPKVGPSQITWVASSRLTCNFRSEADTSGATPGGEYESMAMAMTYAPALRGRIVMHYAGPEAARADVETRGSVLRDGVSPVTSTPYREMLRVEAVSVDASDLVIDVTPLDERGDLYRGFVEMGDFGFALC